MQKQLVFLALLMFVGRGLGSRVHYTHDLGLHVGPIDKVVRTGPAFVSLPCCRNRLPYIVGVDKNAHSASRVVK
jgi:hypothetical protein